MGRAVPIAAGLLPFGATEPRSVAAAGVVDPTGVDLSCGLTLSYAAPGGVPVPPKAGTCPPRGATVSLYTAIDAESAETTTYIGQKGRITVLPPAHCPQNCGRLKGKAGNARFEFEFPFQSRNGLRAHPRRRGRFFFTQLARVCVQAAR